jgi:hypothetical protein
MLQVDGVVLQVDGVARQVDGVTVQVDGVVLQVVQNVATSLNSEASHHLLMRGY